MIGFFSKLFGGNKSDKDVKRIQPIVAQINSAYNELQSLSHDQLRNKTQEFRQRIQDHLKGVDEELSAKKTEAETHQEEDLQAREAVYEAIDKLEKRRNEQIEE